MQCTIRISMALYLNNTHVLYYNMDAFRSIMLGHSYFMSPDCYDLGVIGIILCPDTL